MVWMCFFDDQKCFVPENKKKICGILLIGKKMAQKQSCPLSVKNVLSGNTISQEDIQCKETEVQYGYSMFYQLLLSLNKN